MLGGGGLIAIFVGLNLHNFGHPASWIDEIPSLRLSVESYRHLMFYFDRRAASFNLGLQKKSGENPLFVFVLGESATRNRWGMYGYEKDTTPCMSKLGDELVVFTDVVTSAANTPEAMKYLFTEATQKEPYRLNCTFSSILKTAGFRCVLFSAQGRWGKYGGMEMLCFDGCDVIKILPEENLPKPWYDDSLLGYFRDELIRPEPTVVFLHLNGSHFPFFERYPQDKARFTEESRVKRLDMANPQKVSGQYDNSIAFTDWFLGEIVCCLRKEKRPTMMLYLSDHGESVNSESCRQPADMSVWEIPMVCWFSKTFSECYPETVREMRQARDRPLQTERLLTGLVSLFQVAGYGSAEDDFHGERFVPKPRMIGEARTEYVRKGSK